MKKKPTSHLSQPASKDATSSSRTTPLRHPRIAGSLIAAIRNVSTFGDTDIFPYSFEQHIFRDRPDLLQNALERLHTDFDTQLARNPPDNINTLCPVGYTGFRWATQIDPLWNAYYLALVIDIGTDIEAARIPINESTVFSYRFQSPGPDGSIFNPNVTWQDFMSTCVSTANHYPFVVACDISDFYARVYHHRIENALKWLNTKGDIVKRIVGILQVFSGTVSYGLPVGGPASRLLAELSLNSVDKLLRSAGIRFCRYVDDYRIFCQSREQAYQSLIFLSEKLFNEGLSLQKHKTRILTSKEFRDESQLLIRTHTETTSELTDEDKLLRLTISFDPYSDTRVDDYEQLKSQVAEIDIAAILGRELRKSRIDAAVTKQAISALRAVEPKEQASILSSLLTLENLHTLSPAFPRLMTVLRTLYTELDSTTQDIVESALLKLIEVESHIIRVDINLAYLLAVLRRRHTSLTESVFVSLFKSNTSPLVRREIILAWIGWRHHYALTDLKRQFSGLSKWERRAFVVASYVLTDEGKFWRKHHDDGFDLSECVVRDWWSSRMNSNPSVIL